jgi:hypothetical protein
MRKTAAKTIIHFCGRRRCGSATGFKGFRACDCGRKTHPAEVSPKGKLRRGALRENRALFAVQDGGLFYRSPVNVESVCLLLCFAVTPHFAFFGSADGCCTFAHFRRQHSLAIGSSRAATNFPAFVLRAGIRRSLESQSLLDSALRADDQTCGRPLHAGGRMFPEICS